MLKQARRSSAIVSVAVALLLGVLLTGAVTLRAQAAATPITLGENKTGQVADTQTPLLYTITVGAPQSVTILVLAVTPGFAPTFRVLDPGGVVILDTTNPGTQTIAQGSPNLSSSGAYSIEVRAASSTPGQFLISVQPGAPLAPPQALTPGVPINGLVSAQTTRQAYSFSGTPNDALLLSVRSLDSASNPVVSLRDADTGETLGLSSARLPRVNYGIAAAPGNYLVEILHSAGNGSASFVICLATESRSATCPGTTSSAALNPPVATLVVAAPSLTPTFAPVAIDPNGACQVTSARGQAINVRGGPGTGNPIVGSLPPNRAGLVIGRVADNSWFQVNVNGTIGWVSATVVILGGNCSGVSVVALPTAAPVTVPITVPTLEPTILLPTTNPGGILETLPPAPRLDYRLSPGFGTSSLFEGFNPDPYSIGASAGGEVDVSYLGGCIGWTTIAPTALLNYDFVNGGSTRLSFFFITGAGDTAMVIRDPDGAFRCNDDFQAYGNNPMIDLYFPQVNGTYSIWLTTLQGPNTYLGGTLYVTADPDNNHP